MRRIAIVAVSLLLLPTAAAAHPAPTLPTVAPQAETPPNFDDKAGGKADADDPAIWVHPTDKAKSLVIGTLKNAGLAVFDLAGNQVQAIAPPAGGRFNNVDLVHGFRLGGRATDIAVVSDRGRDRLRGYAVDPGTGRLTDVTVDTPPLAFSADEAEVATQRTAYGLATFRGPDGRPYAVVTRRHTTTIGLFRLVAAGDRLTYERVDTLDFPSTFRLPDGQSWSPCETPGEAPQLEGLVVDPFTRTLYAAQEDVALWRVQIIGGHFASRPRMVEPTREYGVPATYDPATDTGTPDFTHDPGFGGRIAADVEGLTIYRTGPLTGTLLVSSQGDSTFYTYDRLTNRPLTHFAVTPSATVDGSQNCDGAATDSTPLPGYPHGLLVVHDGVNTPDVPAQDGKPRPNTNFKYLDAAILSSPRG